MIRKARPLGSGLIFKGAGMSGVTGARLHNARGNARLVVRTRAEPGRVSAKEFRVADGQREPS